MHRLRGFTLIELLIVVAIIAILAAIAVPNFLEAQTRAKVSRVRADQRSLATAIESYYIDYNRYPLSVDKTTDATWSPRIRAYTALTTPVAYITSAFPDAFNATALPPAGFGASDQRVLVYWGTDFLVEYITMSGTTVNQRPRTAQMIFVYWPEAGRRARRAGAPPGPASSGARRGRTPRRRGRRRGCRGACARTAASAP